MGFSRIFEVGPFKTSKKILITQFLKVVPFKVMISYHFKGSHLKNHKKSKFSMVLIITLKGPTLKIIENLIWTY